MRRAFVDLGANRGIVSEQFSHGHPDHDIYCFEPNRDLIPQILDRTLVLGRPFAIYWAAAWSRDGVLDFFQSGAHEAATVVPGKREYGDWPQIDYAKPYRVPCVNFGAWLRRSFAPGDEVIVKMDVEGAEYEILPAIVEDGSITLISKLACEFHLDRFPDITPARHDAIRASVEEYIKIDEWL